MNRTESALRTLFAALDSPAYDIGVLDDRGMHPRLESLPPSRVIGMLPYLRHRNAQGANIFFRPSGESRYTLLDDLTTNTLVRLKAEGFEPAAVVETSLANFQAWLKHTQPFPKELGTVAAKLLARRFHADPGAADWRRFGRLPGFTNRKPCHRSGTGLYPFTRLRCHAALQFSSAESFRAEVLAVHAQQEQERASNCLSSRTDSFGSGTSLTLGRFRSLPRYAGVPAAADMAFAIAAFTRGWTADNIGAALVAEYLSRDRNQARRAAYVRRTLRKAQLWVR